MPYDRAGDRPAELAPAFPSVVECPCLPSHSMRQVMFPWSDTHLHSFHIHGKMYGRPRPTGPHVDVDYVSSGTWVPKCLLYKIDK